MSLDSPSTPPGNPALAGLGNCDSAFPDFIDRVGEQADRARTFWRNHLTLPLLAFIGIGFWLTMFHGDLVVSDWMYALEGGQWTLREGFVTQTLIHVAGKYASALAWLGVAVAAGITTIEPRLRHWARPLACLALSTLSAVLLVTWMKTWTNVDCPWALARYGGHLDYLGVFGHRDAARADGACFPGGHSSAGYSWVALYFFALAVRPRWRWRGLGVGLSAGLVFGFSQELRGAHFMSHDLTTAMICWLCALGWHVALRPGATAGVRR